MLRNKFYLNIIIRVILISLTAILLGYSVFIVKDLLININLIALIFIQVWLLIRKINSTNNELSIFFDSINYEDTTWLPKSIQNWKSYNNLRTSLEKLNVKISDERISYEAQEAFFKKVVEHVDFGLIAFNEKKEVKLSNSALRNLLQAKQSISRKFLQSNYPHLFETFQTIKPFKKELVNFEHNGNYSQLSIQATKFKLLNENLILISVKDIKTELEKHEYETWYKMVRVLNHEIMNSIGPISSSIKTLKEFLTHEDRQSAKKTKDLNDAIIKDTVKGLHIIDEQSSGLLNFANNFRNLTHFPKPEPEKIKLHEFLTDFSTFMDKELQQNLINFSTETQPENLILEADPKLLSQVLLNIVRNSIQALEIVKEPEITIKAYQSDSQIKIDIRDNGVGIPADTIDQIFIPFFSTKEKGSGIGLSLSRQIMRMHNGNISVQSTVNKGSTFTLMF
ncbi:MAG: GHKL domain-containing protein [Bacteroidetes bacterium]|nr:GHKL domain-containing protein [Bacteroidota bacterium]